MAIGIYHHLGQILDRLNERYFGNQIKAQIKWGKFPKKRRTRSIRLGCYNFDRTLITIHPSLDQAFVPRTCVERVVFHEMLHEYHPPKKNSRAGQKGCIHTPEFMSAEKTFPDLMLAEAWFRNNLHKLLGFHVSYDKKVP